MECKEDINSYYIYTKEKEDKKITNFELTNNIGFTNIGHTCYMNSFLQILLHTPSFLPKLKDIYEKNKIGENTLVHNLIKLSEYPYTTRYLKEIKNIISVPYPKYGLYEQNDTQNFAVDFIDALINELKNETSYESESNEDNKNFEITKVEDNLIYKKNKYNEFIEGIEKSGEKTFIEDLFLIIESTIRYNGILVEKNKVRFDLLLNIELTFLLDNLQNDYTLYELLDIKYNKFNTIFKKVILTDNNKKSIKNEFANNQSLNQKETYTFYDYLKSFLNTINIFKFFNCSCCEKKKSIIKEDYINKALNANKVELRLFIENNEKGKEKEISKIVVLPKILIISFVRGLEGQDLISSFISFEEELDLKDYIEKDLFDRNTVTQYRLFAINIREGFTKTSGHCYSYIKVNNEWINYNDSYVHPEKPSFNLNNVAGLYYLKKDI